MPRPRKGFRPSRFDRVGSGSYTSPRHGPGGSRPRTPMPPLPHALPGAAPVHGLPALSRSGRRREPHRGIRSLPARRRDARHVRHGHARALALPPLAPAARAGVPCVIFTLASVPETMKTLMQAYGAAVVACPTSESRWELMRQGIERFGWYPTSGFVTPPVGSNPWGVEGYKTIAYEVAEDLGWTAPDVVVVPSAYSDGLYGIWKGWTELQALGLVKHAPRMIAAEPFGPLAHALERGLPAPEPVDAPAPSVAFSIASRYGTWQGLAALRESGGAGVRLTDEGVLEAQ